MATKAEQSTLLPVDSKERKDIPLATGVFDYFPAALAEVARVSKVGNDKHNPGQPLHHARGKSMDHADCIARHLLERGKIDEGTGLRHSGELAWRALALLQEEMEAAGAPLARGAEEPVTENAVALDRDGTGENFCGAMHNGWACTDPARHKGPHHARGLAYDTWPLVSL